MKRLFYSIVFFSIVSSCTDNAEHISEVVVHVKQDSLSLSNDTLSTIDTETKFLTVYGDTTSHYFNLVNPVVFADTGYIYAIPDTLSLPLAKLPFNEPLQLNIDAYYPHNDYWTEIIFNNVPAFIPAYMVAPQKFTNYSNGKKYDYFVVNNFDKQNHFPSSGFGVYKYDNSIRQMIDSISIDGHSAHITKQLNHAGWENADMLLYMLEIRPYCGGGRTECYIIDANKKLQTLFFTSSYIDDGEEAGVMEYSVQFPKNVTGDTIVYTYSQHEDAFDKNGKPVMNKEGIIKRTGIDTVYYLKWDGKNLVNLGYKVRTY
jgi:hypothetical protein